MTSAYPTHKSIHELQELITKGEKFFLELSINASDYMNPDKFFLIKSSDNIQDIIIVLKLIEAETVKICEIAYFDENDEIVGEFSADEFIDYYEIE